METTTAAAEFADVTYVTAEDAPLGVQLWPTFVPESAPNYTLMRVETVRTEGRSYVRWIYQNGKERSFDLGQQVAVQIDHS